MSFEKFAFAAGLLALCVGAASRSSAAVYSFQTLDDLGGAKGTAPSGINDAGQIVGIYTDSSFVQHGFTYSGGSFSDFTVASSPGTIYLTYGINNAGTVVGSYGGHGFEASAGAVTTIDDPSASSGTSALGINSSGKVVGLYAGRDGHTTAFTYVGGTFADINIAGTYATRACAVNAAGTAAGLYTMVAPTRLSGFTAQADGSIQLFDEPDGVGRTQVYGIDDAEDVVGSYADSSAVTHGFLRTSQGSAFVFTAIDVPGAISTQALGMNNLGDIVGTYTTSDNGVHGFLATPVPEPVGGALWAAGFVGVAVRRRK